MLRWIPLAFVLVALAALGAFMREGTVESEAFYLFWLASTAAWTTGAWYFFRRSSERVRVGCSLGAFVAAGALLNPVTAFLGGFWLIGALVLSVLVVVALFRSAAPPPAQDA